MMYSGFFKYSLYILIFGYIYFWLIQKNTKSTKYSEKPHGRSLSIFVAVIFLTLLLGFALQLMVSAILQMIDFANPKLLESYHDMVARSFAAKNGIVQLITVMIFAPIGEELLFRGVLLKCSTDLLHRGKIFSVCLTGILFGLYHGEIVQICYAISMGILLGFIAVSFQSIIPSITLHIAVNTSAYLVPSILFHTKETTILTIAVSSLLVFFFCYVFFRLSKSYTKYLDK